MFTDELFRVVHFEFEKILRLIEHPLSMRPRMIIADVLVTTPLTQSELNAPINGFRTWNRNCKIKVAVALYEKKGEACRKVDSLWNKNNHRRYANASLDFGFFDNTRLEKLNSRIWSSWFFSTNHRLKFQNVATSGLIRIATFKYLIKSSLFQYCFEWKMFFLYRRTSLWAYS